MTFDRPRGQKRKNLFIKEKNMQCVCRESVGKFDLAHRQRADRVNRATPSHHDYHSISDEEVTPKRFGICLRA